MKLPTPRGAQLVSGRRGKSEMGVRRVQVPLAPPPGVQSNLALHAECRAITRGTCLTSPSPTAGDRGDDTAAATRNVSGEVENDSQASQQQQADHVAAVVDA